jgi:hypothetical protein
VTIARCKRRERHLKTEDRQASSLGLRALIRFACDPDAGDDE